ECLWCGTKIPLAGRTASPPPTARARLPEPTPSEPAAPAAPAEQPPPPGPRWYEQTPYGVEGLVPGHPALEPALPPATPAAPPKRSSPAVPPPRSEDEGDIPYQFDAPPERPCPGCARPLPADAVLCPACGFDW